MLSNIQIELIKQIKKELLLQTTVLTSNENSIILKKNNKSIKITYNNTYDSYDIEIYTIDKNFNINKEVLNDIYVEQLNDLIYINLFLNKKKN